MQYTLFINGCHSNFHPEIPSKTKLGLRFNQIFSQTQNTPTHSESFNIYQSLIFKLSYYYSIATNCKLQFENVKEFSGVFHVEQNYEPTL